MGRFDGGFIDTESESRSKSTLSPIGDLPGCPEGFMQVRTYNIMLFSYE